MFWGIKQINVLIFFQYLKLLVHSQSLRSSKTRIKRTHSSTEQMKTLPLLSPPWHHMGTCLYHACSESNFYPSCIFKCLHFAHRKGREIISRPVWNTSIPISSQFWLSTCLCSIRGFWANLPAVIIASGAFRLPVPVEVGKLNYQ